MKYEIWKSWKSISSFKICIYMSSLQEPLQCLFYGERHKGSTFNNYLINSPEHAMSGLDTDIVHPDKIYMYETI